MALSLGGPVWGSSQGSLDLDQERPPTDRKISDADVEAIAAAVTLLIRGTATGDHGGPLMNSAEVADYLRISERGLCQLVASGELPVTRVTAGRRGRRFSRASVDELVRRRTKAF